MRRRRRNEGTWLPTIGQQASGEDGLFFQSRSLALETGALETNEFIWGIIPVTYDQPHEGGQLNSTFDSLISAIGSEYFLKRIVGKCHVWVDGRVASQNQDPSGPLSLTVTAGYFIARAGAFPDENSPIGGTNLSSNQTFESYNPEALQTTREPWIWRRSWVVSQQNNEGALSYLIQNPLGDVRMWDSGPQNNWEGRSVADGPHIDAKTRRRVRQDERLWFAVTCRSNLTVSTIVSNNQIVRVHLEHRLFAGLRRAKNSGNF